MSRQKLFKSYTLREKYGMFLESRHYTKVPSKNKFDIYKHPSKEGYLLVGNNGFIRANTKPVIANSYSTKINQELFDKFCEEN